MYVKWHEKRGKNPKGKKLILILDDLIHPNDGKKFPKKGVCPNEPVQNGAQMKPTKTQGVIHPHHFWEHFETVDSGNFSKNGVSGL